MANGRLGAKCIPAYKSCEVYQNSSGSEASVSIVVQGLDSSINNSITVAAGTTTYCISPSRCEGHVGTNCYVDTAALTIAGTARTELHGAFISSSGTFTIGSCTARYPNITSYINPCDGTKTSIATTAICKTDTNGQDDGRINSCDAFTNGPVAPYGGNEMILPVQGMMRNMRCSDYAQCSAVSDRLDCMPCDFFMKYDCNTRGVLLIESKVYFCCHQCAGALFIDASSRCGRCGYDCCTFGVCSIQFSSYCPNHCCACEYNGCAHRYHATINHYSLGRYKPARTTNTTGGVRLICSGCSLYFQCWNSSQQAVDDPNNTCSEQAMITGFVGPRCSASGQVCPCEVASFSIGVPRQCFNSSCCLFTHSCIRVGNSCWTQCSAANAVRACISGASLLGCCMTCCEDQTGSLYSPYGVQRGATYGLGLMHMQTCNDSRAIYFMWDPVRSFGYFDNCLHSVNWNDFRISVPAVTEFPVKWIAHNPKSTVEKTYFMSRSASSDSCGIFEYDWQLFHCYSGKSVPAGCNCEMLNITYNCEQVMKKFCDWTCSCYITKVADFPTSMLCTKYITPQMCVGCLYRMGTQAEPFWSMSIYNHDTTAWDRFTTDDLLTWTNSGSTFNWDVATTCSLTANASCIVSLCNDFADAVPKCGYMDHGVSANNYERTGIVLSDGDSIYVNNCTGTAGLAVQVWGYEG